MAGLRERQKRQRRDAILNAAIDLFERKGFEDTTIEEVAERAGLSVPTLYRYVRSKGELLLALQRAGIERLTEQGQWVLEAPPADPVEAMRAIFLAQNSDLFDSKPGSKELQLWRMVVSEAIRAPEPLARSYFAGDAALVRQLEQLCELLKARGRIAAKTDSRMFAQLLSFAARGFFRARLMGSRISDEEIRQTFGAFAQMLFDGIRPPSR